MDRTLVYPSGIPLDTDILTLNKNAMIGLGFLAQACLGSNVVVDGLVCTPTNPASMTINIGPGSILSFGSMDSQPYGSLAADTSTSLVKMGTSNNPHVDAVMIRFLLFALPTHRT